VTSTPDEPEGGRPDPDAVDAAFEAIVSRLTTPQDDPDAPAWPDAEETGSAESTGEVPSGAPTPVPLQRGPDRDWAEWDDLRIPSTEPDDEPDEDADEGHFVPPEPAPVPRGEPRVRWAWAAALGAPVLAIVLPLLGFGLDGLTGIALVIAFLLGFGFLLSRLRDGPRIDDGPDDGAVV
jgi:hypothetical protein